MGRVLLLAGLVVVGACSAWGASSEPSVTPVEQCPGQKFENLKESVHVTHCTKMLCKLRKGRNSTRTIHFKPSEQIANVVTVVSANVLGLDLPFIGVTGTSACGQIKKADSGEAASCPLSPDTEYIYSNTFPIEQFYPTTQLKVHWSLTDGKKDIICFELPAAIK